MSSENKTNSVNEIFYGLDSKDKVKLNHFIERGRIRCVSNKAKKTTKMESRGKVMMMVGYNLDHPSRKYCFYNADTYSIIMRNSVK